VELVSNALDVFFSRALNHLKEKTQGKYLRNFGINTKEVICSPVKICCRAKMLIRVVRRLTMEEVLKRIKDFEKEHGVTFDEFEELFLEKRLNIQNVDVYFEWADLVHAYRGYVEGGELDYIVEELRDLNPNEIALLTPKRLQLLYSLAGLRVRSINDLAQKTRRNVKNIYQDLQILRKLGFVAFKKIGKRNIIPETLVEEITLMIR
jgi:hypothetical protein